MGVEVDGGFQNALLFVDTIEKQFDSRLQLMRLFHKHSANFISFVGSSTSSVELQQSAGILELQNDFIGSSQKFLGVSERVLSDSLELLQGLIEQIGTVQRAADALQLVEELLAVFVDPFIHLLLVFLEGEQVDAVLQTVALALIRTFQRTVLRM